MNVDARFVSQILQPARDAQEKGQNTRLARKVAAGSKLLNSNVMQ